ncbi:MAG TPA: galactokinase [Bdellovibrionota bacterium]|nr:galactokinase [Bdellovibrionota bacterium]
MIIARSPLRITLGGGGTDLPSYYRKHGGFLIAAGIDKYVYVIMQRTFADRMMLRYSEIEKVNAVSEIRHPIFREALSMLDLHEPNLEITTFADVPAGTGLGSSGSFTTALLKAGKYFKKNISTPEQIARMACEIELDRLKEPIGKQDQYIAAFGGLTCFQFNADDTVDVTPLPISEATLNQLSDNLLLFSTGFTRDASAILKEQDKKSQQDDQGITDHLHYVKEMGYRSMDYLKAGNLDGFAGLMHEHWEHKKKRSQKMSNGEIDRWYRAGLDAGALGGKLIGAGGGGFLMFYSPEPARLRKAMASEGLRELRFDFDFEGTKVVN